jgi:hypothetical protein
MKSLFWKPGLKASVLRIKNMTNRMTIDHVNKSITKSKEKNSKVFSDDVGYDHGRFGAEKCVI